jgi:hypothetical protein
VPRPPGDVTGDLIEVGRAPIPDGGNDALARIHDDRQAGNRFQRVKECVGVEPGAGRRALEDQTAPGSGGVRLEERADVGYQAGAPDHDRAKGRKGTPIWFN